MAYVQGSANFYATVTIDVGGGVIALETQQGLGPGEPTQHRTFQWQDSEFVQLTGPTEAPDGQLGQASPRCPGIAAVARSRPL